jgi:hypothetical protein
MQGFMLMVSMAMVSMVIGFNLILLLGEVRTHSRKKKEMQQFSGEYQKDNGDRNAGRR